MGVALAGLRLAGGAPAVGLAAGGGGGGAEVGSGFQSGWCALSEVCYGQWSEAGAFDGFAYLGSGGERSGVPRSQCGSSDRSNKDRRHTPPSATWSPSHGSKGGDSLGEIGRVDDAQPMRL